MELFDGFVRFTRWEEISLKDRSKLRANEAMRDMKSIKEGGSFAGFFSKLSTFKLIIPLFNTKNMRESSTSDKR